MGSTAALWKWTRRTHTLTYQHTTQQAVRVAAVTLALAAIGVALTSAGHDEGASYDFGYAAASNPTFVRSALSDEGRRSTSFCDALLKRAMAGAQLTGIRHSDFLRGCDHAVHDVME